MFDYRTRGVVAAAIGVVGFGCTDPTQLSDLRPEGPPEVLTVVVNSIDHRPGYEGLSIENATFCKTTGPDLGHGPVGTGDDKRPNQVSTIDTSIIQVCPDNLSMDVDKELDDAMPESWYFRIVFDELLNPDIEELVPILDENGEDTGTFNGTIANTLPVKLQCHGISGALVDVGYDGYYSPSGNSITYPLGPSIVVKPNDPTLISTKSECQFTINDNVVDKDGNPVPEAQRGPYKFKLAPIQILAISPLDASLDPTPVDAEFAGIDLTFNTAIDETTLLTDGTVFTITPDPGAQYEFAEAPEEFFIGADFPVSNGFTFAITPGAKIKDQCGIETTFTAADVATNTQAEFSTSDLLLNGIAPFDGAPSAAPSAKIKLDFNQYMDATTFLASEFTLTPAVPNSSIGTDPVDPSKITIFGDFSPNTNYTFSLHAGATIDDCPGAEDQFGGPCVPSVSASVMNAGTYTNATIQGINFKTAPITMTATSPADNGVVTKVTPATTTKIKFTFNQDMVPASLDATEWTLTPAVAMVVASGAGVDYGGNAIVLRNVVQLTGALPAGSYTFTLKGSATFLDVLTPANSFTPGTDKVIHFTVEDPPPPDPTPPACL